MNRITIPNRINWIDWAKVIAISFVVFGHIPMNSESLPLRYITNFHMPLFFFISGYLTKKEYFGIETTKKYWHTLIIPYLFYNIVFYPYWIIRHLIEFPHAELVDFIKPLIGVFFLQLRTPISTPLNEVTWFVAVLLIMKLVLSIANLHKKGIIMMSILSVLCALLFICNNHLWICKNLPIIGFYRSFPFFLIGHLCKQKALFPIVPTRHDLYYCLGGIGISVTSFYFLFMQPSSIVKSSMTYLVAAISIIGVISVCRLLDKIHSSIIDNLSIGTIVIMGLHWMLIGTTNYILAKILHIEGGITYLLGFAIILTIFFEALLYPIIILFIKKYPFLLGKYTTTRSH